MTDEIAYWTADDLLMLDRLQSPSAVYTNEEEDVD